jgi:hypothetical protein
MRVDLRKAKPETLFEALTRLQYARLNSEGTEWRHGKFHLFIRMRKRGVVLNMHVDNPSPLPPFHRARYRGRDLELELQRIRDAYAKLRSGK